MVNITKIIVILGANYISLQFQQKGGSRKYAHKIIVTDNITAKFAAQTVLLLTWNRLQYAITITNTKHFSFSVP